MWCGYDEETEHDERVLPVRDCEIGVYDLDDGLDEGGTKTLLGTGASWPRVDYIHPGLSISE